MSSTLKHVGSCNQIQEAYITKIKESIKLSEANSLPVLRENPLLTMEGLCCKPVLIIAPDIQFRDVDLKCPCSVPIESSEPSTPGRPCGQNLKSNGWQTTHRYIHSNDTGMYVLQKIYMCALHGCKDALDVIRDNGTPEYVKVFYPVVWGDETVFHKNLANFILNSALTAQIFDGMGEGEMPLMYIFSV